MKRVALLLTLAAGCAPAPRVDALVPPALARSRTVAVAYPGGHSFALKPDVLQREVARGLRRAGFENVTMLAEGESGRGNAELLARVGSELMARPLENGALVTP